MINPFLLWFLPLAALPIALHLITRFRLRTVELSTFRFLMESYVQQRRRVKLLEFLLMLLRTLFVLLIVLTLARPVVDRFASLFGGSGGGRDVSLIIDAGASMALNEAGTSSLDRAKAAAKTVLSRLGPADHITLIRAAHKPEVVANAFASDAKAMIAKIDSIKPDLTAADIPAAIGEALAGDAQGVRVVYMFTDAQRRAWSALSDHPVLKKIDAKTKLVMLNVGPNKPVANLAVVGDPPRALRPVVGLPVMLTATVAASKAGQPVDARLSVMLDDEQVNQINVNLQPGQRVTRPITVTPKKAGVLHGKFTLADDAFPDDNEYLFCLNVEPHVRVLLVTGDRNAKGADDPALYIRSALKAPLLARGLAGTTEQRIAESLELTELNEDQLNENHLAVADVVILADVRMDDHRGRMLRDYVQSGGGLFVLTGKRVQPDDYKKYLLTDRDVADKQPPPLWYEQPRGDPDNEATFEPVSALDLNHPVLSAFDDHDEKAQYFATVRLYRCLPISMNGPTATPLMRLPDRRAALAETHLGDGRIMLAAFAATPDWSNLPLKPEFVPVLLRSVAYLRRPEPIEAVQSVRPHEPAPIRLADPWTHASVQVTEPNGHTQAIELHRSDRVMIGALTEPAAKGYYTYSIQPAADAPGDLHTQTRGFAVNLDVDDAGFEAMPKQQLTSMFDPHELVYLHGSPDDPVLLEQLTERHEIWRTLIWAMFAVIGIEFLLSTLKPAGSRDSGGKSTGMRRAAERLGLRANAPQTSRQEMLHR